MTIKSFANNNSSMITLEATCYKMMKTRKVKNLLLTMNYTVIYV
jgi:hypothetical protein